MEEPLHLIVLSEMDFTEFKTVWKFQPNQPAPSWPNLRMVTKSDVDFSVY
ncbi:hypothetical protein V144x_56090 [Gimesia aquarii]|uniref:Uncharacterized protein n=1 Tax=Gimesia aquarii TaxID=2527964 RepID=A0A517W4B5_9PLAN|nr:hypothetical protein V144x_56090 [Gimesia aquarii]